MSVPVGVMEFSLLGFGSFVGTDPVFFVGAFLFLFCSSFSTSSFALVCCWAFPVEAALVAPSAVSVELEPSALGWPSRQTKIKHQINYFDKINDGDIQHLEYVNVFLKKEKKHQILYVEINLNTRPEIAIPFGGAN